MEHHVKNQCSSCQWKKYSLFGGNVRNNVRLIVHNWLCYTPLSNFKLCGEGYVSTIVYFHRKTTAKRPWNEARQTVERNHKRACVHACMLMSQHLYVFEAKKLLKGRGRRRNSSSRETISIHVFRLRLRTFNFSCNKQHVNQCCTKYALHFIYSWRISRATIPYQTDQKVYIHFSIFQRCAQSRAPLLDSFCVFHVRKNCTSHFFSYIVGDDLRSNAVLFFEISYMIQFWVPHLIKADSVFIKWVSIDTIRNMEYVLTSASQKKTIRNAIESIHSITTSKILKIWIASLDLEEKLPIFNFVLI